MTGIPRKPTAIDLISRLGRLFLFRNWNREDLAVLARTSAETRHRRGDNLFWERDPCSHLLVLTDGKVQMYRTTADGREVTLHVVHAEALVACAALFLDQCYPACARVVSLEATVFRFPGTPFLKFLEDRPDLARKMISSLAMRIGELADRIEARQTMPAQARLADWLSEQPSLRSADGKRVINIEGSKKSVASTLGMTPETFSRSLACLARAGIIAVRGKEVVLLKPGDLLDQSG